MGAQNFALFSPLPPSFSCLFSLSKDLLVSFFLSLGVFSCPFFSLWGSSRVFFLSLGVFSWNFDGVFGRPGPSNVCVFASGCRVKAPCGLQAAGVSHARGRKRAHLRVPADQNTKTPRERKRHEKTPSERKKDTRMEAREGNQREMLGGPAEGGPAEGGAAKGRSSGPHTTHTTQGFKFKR